MIMCHMVADTLDEMHEMAEKVGVRQYYQQHAKYPHYDICQSKRTQALVLGAHSVRRRELLAVAKKLRVSLHASSEERGGRSDKNA